MVAMVATVAQEAWAARHGRVHTEAFGTGFGACFGLGSGGAASLDSEPLSLSEDFVGV